MVRIATWNVNSLRARLPRVLSWLEATRTEVVCLQETKQSDLNFDPTPFEALGYQVLHHGDGQWNGVAIVSSVGLSDPIAGFGRADLEAGCRILTATCGGIRVSSVYAPNGRALDDPHYEVKLHWFEQLETWLRDEGLVDVPHAICGDFNIAPSELDVYDPQALVGMTHVSDKERAALERLFSLGYRDAYRTINPEQQGFSWWDYRGGAFHQNHGMRIDLLLTSPLLTSRVTEAAVDRAARKGEKPSDHAPVTISLID